MELFKPPLQLCAIEAVIDYGYPQHQASRVSTWLASQGYHMIPCSEQVYMLACSMLCKCLVFYRQRKYGQHGCVLSSQRKGQKGLQKSTPGLRPPLYSCSSGWGWTHPQCEMGTGHVHGTVATPRQHAVVQIRGKGELKPP